MWISHKKSLSPARINYNYNITSEKHHENNNFVEKLNGSVIKPFQMTIS